MIAELAVIEEAYGQNWHIPGAGLISGTEIVRIAREASRSTKPVIPLGKLGLSLLGMSIPVMKEIVEMLYLTQEPLVLSGEKYERLIGAARATSFEEGISTTIRMLQQQRKKSV